MHNGCTIWWKLAIWQPCRTNMATMMVVRFSKLFHVIPHPQKMGLGGKIMFLSQLGGKLCTKVIQYGENWKSGNPVVQVWQP